jgi:hypothetical protein
VAHAERRGDLAGFTNDFRWYASNTRVWRHIFEYYTTRAHFGTFTDFDITEYLGTRTEQNARTYFRVTVATVFTGSA